MTKLQLAALAPIAKGYHRYVYAHPQAAGLLVKVMRPDTVAERWNAPRRWYKRLSRTREYTGYVRELKEYVAVRARSDAADLAIAAAVGVIETDLGLGLVVDCISAPDGGLAPTLDKRVRNEGLSEEIVWELDALLARLLRDEVILADLHPWNIVFGGNRGETSRFILIDGYGDKHAIPYCSMSRILNRHNTRRLYRKLLARVRAIASSKPAT